MQTIDVARGTSHDELLAGARALVPVIAARANQAEADRRLPAATIEELVALGVPGALVPRVFGGAQLGLRTWMEVAAELGRGCASTAWCASLAMHYGLVLGLFPEPAQEAVWRDGPDVLVAAALFQSDGAITRTDAGFAVTGSFPNASGVDHASWVLVGGPVVGPDRKPGPPDYQLFLLPPGSYTVRDTWFATGMRATGSNTIVAADVVVPPEHTLSLRDKVHGTTPGGALHGGMYQLPWSSYTGITFVPPMLGAARGALEEFTSRIAGRRTLGGGAVAEQHHVIAGVAEVHAALDAAELLLARAVTDASGPDRPPASLQRRATRDWCYSARLVTGALDRLLRLCGTSVHRDGSPIQRAWRDVHTAASHVSLDFDTTAVGFGRELLGLPAAGGNPFA
jgi:3-hydroxy-9,10-secoandrosta-1,3,5(10)-triene-9,17-dione monooxygenase